VSALTVTLRHNRIDLALHRLPGRAERAERANGRGAELSQRNGEGEADSEGRPLLHLHGLGERSPVDVPDHLAAWPGPVWALDFTGHGASTVPVGGGYFSELLMGDVDAALAHLGPATLYGRGLGAYIALMTAGSRPDLVRGAILDDGPGMTGGGTEPTTSFVLGAPLAVTGSPDPYALLELSHDVRPPDYATTYARQAATLSGLDTALAVAAVVRPPWLAAVSGEPGVVSVPRDTCIALFADI
jgi:pimeloyl-ACP methyl ester carboxylesterase